MNDTPRVSAENETPAITASEMLKAARQAMGLTQQGVAEQLYLTPAVIAHIDSGDIGRIAKQVFVWGYLRSYAKLVKLDDNLVIQQYNKLQADGHQLTEIRGVTEETVGPNNFTGPVVKTGVVGLIGLALIVLVVWLAASLSEQQPVISTEEISASELTQLAPEQQALGLQESIATPPYIAESEIVTAHAKPDRAADRHLQPEVDQMSKLQEANVLGRDIFIEKAGSDKLVLTFVDECWIEIVDNSGTIIYADLNRGGDVLRVSGTAPFEILLGKAPVANMTFNDRVIDLEPHITSLKTATIRLGE